MVEADRGQIEQILMNLAVNARDAMPRGGTLALETEVVSLTEAEAAGRLDAAPGEYALLRVSDTGHGMDAATRARAFEPFFTTKPPGEGTGLGLATVFGGVRQNGGHIILVSEPGSGTTFEILLPLVHKDEPVGEPVDPAPPNVRGRERVLLVEDDPVVRDLTRELLAGRGYDVRAATGPVEAIEIFRLNEFDVVVTDMVMPKLSGKELAVRLRAERPEIPIVFVSGYAHDAVGAGGMEPGETFVQKPYSADDLASAVRASLGWNGAAPGGDR